MFCMVVLQTPNLLYDTMQRGRGLYHHYVPRFILRGFAVSKPSRCFTDDGNGAFIETKLKLNRRNPTYDRMNVYHLEGARLIMASDHTTSGDFTNTVDRNFGLRDLYVDESHPDSEHIENSLSKLEFEASKVVKAAIAALESPEQEFRLPRRDLNTLRKFLFIMSYRTSRRGQQFLDNRFDDETRMDIDHHIKTYLPEGSTARDVWLQNIKEILDTDYWLIPDNPRIFVHDRVEFADNMRMKHIVFWSATSGREFITCNNGFGFVDSATIARRQTAVEASAMADMLRQMGSVVDDNTLPRGMSGNFDWIRLFPLHPKLNIALVQNLMLFAGEDSAIPTSRYHTMPRMPHKTVYVGLSPQLDYAWTSGRLDDYMVEQNQMGSTCYYLDGKLLESRVDDIFVFPLIPLDAEQTHRVNEMFLENVGAALAFVAPGQLYRSIIHYEANTIWEHKRNYTALKAALRAYSQLTHDAVYYSPANEATLVDNVNAERRMVWVSSSPRSPEDPPNARQILAILKMQQHLSRLPPGVPAMGRDQALAHLNRTHMDSLLRNEESEMARRANAASAPSPAYKPPARPIPTSRVPDSKPAARAKKPSGVNTIPQAKPSPTIIPPSRPAVVPQPSTLPGSPAARASSNASTPATPTATEIKPTVRKRNRNRNNAQAKVPGNSQTGNGSAATPAWGHVVSPAPADNRTTVASGSGNGRPGTNSAPSSSQQGPSTPAAVSLPPTQGGGGAGKKKRSKRK